jgi:hypothetical protein
MNQKDLGQNGCWCVAPVAHCLCVVDLLSTHTHTNTHTHTPKHTQGGLLSTPAASAVVRGRAGGFKVCVCVCCVCVCVYGVVCAYVCITCLSVQIDARERVCKLMLVRECVRHLGLSFCRSLLLISRSILPLTGIWGFHFVRVTQPGRH